MFVQNAVGGALGTAESVAAGFVQWQQISGKTLADEGAQGLSGGVT